VGVGADMFVGYLCLFLVWCVIVSVGDVSWMLSMLFIRLLVFYTSQFTLVYYRSTIQLFHHHPPILFCIIYSLIFYVACVVKLD